jgi:hypothetical protein
MIRIKPLQRKIKTLDKIWTMIFSQK